MPDYYSVGGADLHRSNEEYRDKADLDRALFGWSKPRNTVMLTGSPGGAIRNDEIEALLAELDAMPADDTAGKAADSHPAPDPVFGTGEEDRPSTGLPVDPEPATEPVIVAPATVSDAVSFPAPEPAEVDRNGKSKRLKSVYRDARFYMQIQALAESGASRDPAGTSVKDYKGIIPSTASTSQPSTTPTLTTSEPSESDSHKEAGEEASASERASHVNASCFWSAYAVPTPHLPQHRAPAAWRDVSGPLRLTYYTRAILGTGNAYAFTLNLHPAIAARAIAEGTGACRWIAKRIAHHLKTAFGHVPPLWFALEDSDDRRLHLHGVLTVAEADTGKARAALRKAAGEWETTRQHQCITKPVHDDGWSAYASKHFMFHGRHIRKLLKGRRFEPSFTGPWYYATADLKKPAEALYNADRRKLMAA